MVARRRKSRSVVVDRSELRRELRPRIQTRVRMLGIEVKHSDSELDEFAPVYTARRGQIRGRQCGRTAESHDALMDHVDGFLGDGVEGCDCLGVRFEASLRDNQLREL